MVQTQIPLRVTLGHIPFNKQLLALHLCEQRQIREANLRVLHHTFEQCLEVHQHAQDESLFKEIRIILQLTVQPLWRSLVNREHQVKHTGHTLHPQGRDDRDWSHRIIALPYLYSSDGRVKL